MQRELEFQTVVTAAYLHDIGKLIGRVNRERSNGSRWHPILGKEWLSENRDIFQNYIDVQLAESLILYHHETAAEKYKEYLTSNAPIEIRPLAFIVDRADSFSSKERVEGSANGRKQAGRVVWLPSLLRRKGDIGNFAGQIKYLPYFQKSRLLAVSDEPEDDLQRLNKEKLGEIVDRLKGLAPGSFEEFLAQLDQVMADYFRYFPSDLDNPLRDISLLDHSRTTAAIASAMYRWHKLHSGASESFELAVVKIDGYDEFTSIELKRALKTLKARTEYAQVLLNEFVKKVLEIYGLTFLNEVARQPLASWLLLQDDGFKVNEVEELRKEVNEKLLLAGQPLKIRIGRSYFDGQGFDNMTLQIQVALRNADNDSPYARVLNGRWGHPILDLRDLELELPPGRDKSVLSNYDDIAYLLFRVDEMEDLILNGVDGLTISGGRVEKSISRIVAANTAVDAFFGWLKERAESDGKREVAYSRNGEALVYGEWQSVFDLLKEVYGSFGAYFANELVTASAAVRVVDAKTPFWYVLNRLRDDVKRIGESGGNRLSILGRPVKWTALSTMLQRAKWLKEMVEGKIFSRSLLHDVYIVGEDALVGRVDKVPVLLANIVRNLRKETLANHGEKIFEWTEKVKAEETERGYLWFVSWYALLATGKGEEAWT